jgi:hypothetical protein
MASLNVNHCERALLDEGERGFMNQATGRLVHANVAGVRGITRVISQACATHLSDAQTTHQTQGQACYEDQS